MSMFKPSGLLDGAVTRTLRKSAQHLRIKTRSRRRRTSVAITSFFLSGVAVCFRFLLFSRLISDCLVFVFAKAASILMREFGPSLALGDGGVKHF